MDFSMLINGFLTALTPENLLFGFIGCLAGTLIGVLPGLGPTSGIAILLPLTTILPPIPAIIMLSGIYYGAMYGGSTTAILVNIPGEVGSVATALDGYQLAKQGKAGPALATAAISSFVAGTLSLIGLTFFAPTLANVALRFGPPEYFALMILALSVVINLTGRSLVKGLISALIGFLIAMVGMESVTGYSRFTFGNINLMSGIDFISVIIGLFAVGEIFSNLEHIGAPVYNAKLQRLYLTAKEFFYITPTMIRSAVVGFFLGLLPGCSPGVTSFMSYDIEKRISKHPETFGKGDLRGVAAPEGANNATTSGGFVPLLSFGIPSGPALAVLLGGFMMYGLQPGPTLFEKNADLVWAVIASMYIGNVILIILNLPLVPFWAKLVKVPYGILAPMVLVFSFIGAYSVRFKLFDVGVAIFFGLVGWLFKKIEIPTTPLILCLILGTIFETSLRQSLNMSHGSLVIFFTRPISLTLLAVAAVLLAASLYTRIKNPGAVQDALAEESE
ncbi:putative tricarboxylic transport membrane protein [Desulfitobacterium chlororespirans DSM 11544]|uniref:Putative tricarboxylic transport membrane protein n=2 Tax=Desulfitobacterium chlororespirans TaxID=51616 RepID=A0A1M7UYT3_9FIRM|nr:tripartite tricarboxylate transporter permease [Desulfitobacterium chlororespirans]SHN88080.1 putative tricarboxylic transport membrane protein [Desulfitobacterium chlororespirans DSM 11544]